MEKILYLEKRGCDFFKGDRIKEKSDIGNYRVGTYDHSVKGKDGIYYILEFSRADKYITRTEHKRTGKPLKHPKRELVFADALRIDTEYENEKGSWRNSALERELWKNPQPFTLAGILAAVNEISADTYTEIRFIDG